MSTTLKLMMKEETVRMMTISAINLARDAVMECSKRYNFDLDEALLALDLSNVQTERRSGEPKVKKSKSKSLRIKSEFPLPFCGVKNGQCCEGLRLNQGLYTQCMIGKKKGSSYCKVCDDQAQKNENGKPDYGTIDDRLAVELMDYKDPKGKSPIAYKRLMRKLKISEEMVCEEANKYNLTIDPLHFEEAEDGKRGRPKAEKVRKEDAESKKKGRPKKSKKVLEIEGESMDLFAELVASAKEEESEEDEEVVIVAKEVEKEVAIKEKKKVKIVEDEDKEAKKAAKEQEKLKEKEAKEQEKLKKKEEEKAAKEVEKLAKEAEKKEKEAEAKKNQEEKARIAKEMKEAKEAKKVEKEESKEEADVVKKIEYEGKKYLKSKKTGIVYNMEQDVIGKWDEESKKIIFDAQDSDEEEEEEEYDE
jgi:hypothetical protein